MCQSIFLRKVTGLNSSSSMTFQVLLFGNFRAGEMDFKVEGPWNTDKYCRSQERFLNFRRYRMAKTVTF